MIRDARLGVWLIGDDPLGTLLPSGVLLLMQTLVGWVAYRLAPVAAEAPQAVLVAIGAMVAGRALLAAPMLSLIVGAGARSLGRPSRGGVVSLWVVHGVIAILQLVGGAAAVTLGVIGAGWMLAHGWITTAAGLGFAGWMLAGVLGLAVRGLFAYATAEVVVGGRGPLSALARSASRGIRDWVAAMALFALGGSAVAVGALACGMGALPGYPFADLAVLARWHASSGQAPRPGGPR